MREIDGVLVGTIAGMIATLVKDLLNLVLFLFGVVELTYWQLAASTFLRPGLCSSPGGLLVGAMADIILGGVLGMIIVLIFKFFGRDLWWYKGLVAGNAIWLFGAGLAVNVFTRLAPLDIPFRVASLFDHQLYGITAAFFVWYWTRPMVRDGRGL